MPAAITITDEASLTMGQADRSFTLVLPHDTITVKELIIQRVRAEVEAYNREKPPVFPGLVQPAGALRTPSGLRLGVFRPLDWRKQADEALRAFRTSSLIILVNDRQVEHLEDQIAVAADTGITFFRHIQLVGG